MPFFFSLYPRLKHDLEVQSALALQIKVPLFHKYMYPAFKYGIVQHLSIHTVAESGLRLDNP